MNAVTKMGGRRSVSVFLRASRDVADALLPIGEGGEKLTIGAAQRVRETFGGQFELRCIHEPAGPTEELEPSCSELFKSEPDVVVFSIQPEIAAGVPAERFRERFRALVADIKQRLRAHVIVLNCFTFDPAAGARSYAGIEDTPSLRALKLNLALIELSMDEGISIVDVDRLLAELGGALHVTQAFHYSARACELIRDEFVRILADIGFFEQRPLVMQLGRRRA